MKAEEQFALALTHAVLTVAEEDVQLAVLEEMVAEAPTKALDLQLSEARIAGKQAGDFGMEIVGPMLISALLEAGKALWGLYVKKLGEKAAGKLADTTVDGVNKISRAIWHDKDSAITVADYEGALRNAARAEGLSSEQTDRLVAAITGDAIKKVL
jgi:hypothetical protein